MILSEFKEILNKYPKEWDNYEICLDMALPYETIPRLVDPKLYINTDIGQIEIFHEDNRKYHTITTLEAIESLKRCTKDNHIIDQFKQEIEC